MTVPLTVLVSALVVLALTLLLFSYEDRRGERFLARARRSLDIWCARVQPRSGAFNIFAGDGFLRRSLHAGFVYTLALLLRAVRAIEALLVRSMRSGDGGRARRTGSVLDEIRAHKESVALSPREQKRAKEESIGGKL